jgi:hypothetical protein
VAGRRVKFTIWDTTGKFIIRRRRRRDVKAFGRTTLSITTLGLIALRTMIFSGMAFGNKTAKLNAAYIHLAS